MSDASPHVVAAIQSDAAACVPAAVCLMPPHVSAASVLYVVLEILVVDFDTLFASFP
jgi:hypothetical protein